jgi:cation diffusion facilitator CzcD-associated flavoprotein CzcO
MNSREDRLEERRHWRRGADGTLLLTPFHYERKPSRSGEDEKWRDKTVLCIGGRASGTDIAREISCVARKVYVSERGAAVEGWPGREKVEVVGGTVGLVESGKDGWTKSKSSSGDNT